jgi:hypothetical protein
MSCPPPSGLAVCTTEGEGSALARAGGHPGLVAGSLLLSPCLDCDTLAAISVVGVGGGSSLLHRAKAAVSPAVGKVFSSAREIQVFQPQREGARALEQLPGVPGQALAALGLRYAVGTYLPEKRKHPGRFLL